MPARDARTGPTRDRATPAKRSAAGSVVGTSRRDRAAGGNVRAAARRNAAAGPVSADAGRVDGLVIGPVPRLARAVGVLLVAAGVVGAVAAFLPYLVVGGETLSQVAGFGSALVALLVPVCGLAVGIGLLRGSIPKFGLAYAGVAGTVAVGQLLIELYRGSSSTARPAVEVLAGELVLTSGVESRAGWLLGLVALGVTVLAGVCALAAWGRTVMDDGGALDGVRSGLAGTAVLLGVGTVLCLALPAADVPDALYTDPATGMQTVVTREGPQALLERPGLALMGGLLLAGAILVCAVVAPSLRPRLAAVGGLLALTVAVLSAALTGARDALRSPELEWSLPGIGLLFLGIGFAGLTAVAWRARRGRP